MSTVTIKKTKEWEPKPEMIKVNFVDKSKGNDKEADKPESALLKFSSGPV